MIFYSESFSKSPSLISHICHELLMSKYPWPSSLFYPSLSISNLTQTHDFKCHVYISSFHIEICYLDQNSINPDSYVNNLPIISNWMSFNIWDSTCSKLNLSSPFHPKIFPLKSLICQLMDNIILTVVHTRNFGIIPNISPWLRKSHWLYLQNISRILYFLSLPQLHGKSELYIPPVENYKILCGKLCHQSQLFTHLAMPVSTMQLCRSLKQQQNLLPYPLTLGGFNWLALANGTLEKNDQKKNSHCTCTIRMTLLYLWHY